MLKAAKRDLMRFYEFLRNCPQPIFCGYLRAGLERIAPEHDREALPYRLILALRDL